MTISNIHKNLVDTFNPSELFIKVFSQLRDNDVSHYAEASKATRRQCEKVFRERWELLQKISIDSLSPYKIAHHFTRIEEIVNMHFPEYPSFYAQCRKLIKVFATYSRSDSNPDNALPTVGATLSRDDIIPGNTLFSTALSISEFEKIYQKAHDRSLQKIWPRLRAEIYFAMLNSNSEKPVGVPSFWVAMREIYVSMSNDLDCILPSMDAQEETLKIFFSDQANVSLLSNVVNQSLSNGDQANIVLISNAFNAMDQFFNANVSLSDLPPDESSVEEIQNFLNLPATMFLLTKVHELPLMQLDLNMVPDELNRLENLQLLDLSNNPNLISIPDLHFKKLMTLFFNGNPTPEILSLNHLPNLKNLILFANASMLISDDTFQRFPTLIENPLKNAYYSRYQQPSHWEPYFSPDLNEIKAHCESTLALLWQSICTPNFSIEEIKLIVNNGLTPEDRNLIYEMVWNLGGKVENGDLQWGEHHAFDKNKIFHFALAVGLAIWTKLDRLTPEEQNLVYGQIYELAGRPKTADSQWGEFHAFKSMTRLADALARIKK